MGGREAERKGGYLSAAPGRWGPSCPLVISWRVGLSPAHKKCLVIVRMVEGREQRDVLSLLDLMSSNVKSEHR